MYGTGTGQIESDLFGSDCQCRWLVLETPAPEEDLVAAARFILDFERKLSVVDILCSTGEDNEVHDFRLSAILRKLESIVWGHSLKSIIVEVSSWRSDVQEQLHFLGYRDCGGRLYDKEHSLLKPTMILEYRKELNSKSPSNSTASTAIIEHPSLLLSSTKNVPDMTLSDQLEQESEHEISCKSHQRYFTTSVAGNEKNDLDFLVSDYHIAADAAENTIFPTISLNVQNTENFSSLSNISHKIEIIESKLNNDINIHASDDIINDDRNSMENLMSQLFTALHSELPSQPTLP